MISPPFDITAKRMGYEILGDMADLGLPYQHETVATTDKFLKERPETARKFLRAFIAGIHLWMPDEKKTQEILAKRLKIKDKEVLDETYPAYKKLREKSLIPLSKESNFRLKTLPSKTRKPKALSRRTSSI